MTGFKTFTAGEVLTAANVNQYFAQQVLAYKTGDEIVNNSTTLQNDDHLSVAVSASTVYRVDAMLVYQSGTTPDIKWQFTGPAGAVMTGGFLIATTAATDATGEIDVGASASILSSAHGRGGTGSVVIGMFFGLLVVSTTAGTLQLQWAQNTLNATDTTVYTNSYLHAIKRG